MATVTHEPEQSRFTAGEAYLTYRQEDGVLDIRHTVVPEHLSGQGIGGDLVQTAVEHARAEGLELRTTCSYARGWVEKHPDA